MKEKIFFAILIVLVFVLVVQLKPKPQDPQPVVEQAVVFKAGEVIDDPQQSPKESIENTQALVENKVEEKQPLEIDANATFDPPLLSPVLIQ